MLIAMGSTGAKRKDILVVGSGIFGVTGAVSLAARGHRVRLMQPGPMVHPQASSTDISKVVRLDYGSDHQYTAIMERALKGWRKWNTQWEEPLFHPTGVLVLASTLAQGGFEHDSRALLTQRGHKTKALSCTALRDHYDSWHPDTALNGYFSPEGGWAPSGRVVARLHQEAVAAGVQTINTRLKELDCGDNCVRGVIGDDGIRYPADIVVLATGAWTSTLVPALSQVMWPTAQPIFHFRPERPELYAPPRFAPWTADIAKTGFYGFPIHPDGVVKVANHGRGLQVHPDSPGEPGEATEVKFREFLARTLPQLAGAPIVYRRHCLYCDTWDGDFYIDHYPELPGVVLATGGSGHGFKFAPVLGDLIADAVERQPNQDLARFSWRPRGTVTSEEARG